MEQKCRAENLIQSIVHLNLSEEQASILRKAVDEIEELDRKQFEQHLKKSSEIVSGWPAWKQEAFGGTAKSSKNG